MKKYIIAAFYKFVPLNDFENMKEPLLSAMKEHNLLGTILLASEGINGSFAGEPEDVHFLYEFLR